MEKGGKTVGKFFFSGSVNARLDEKNRFVLPQNMRLGLVEEGALEFTLALGLGGCIAIYKQSDIAKIVETFRSQQHIGKYQKFFTLFFSTLYPTTCDKIGRVILPQDLKKIIEIKHEIVIAGVLNKIEIWPKEKYTHQLNSILEGTERDEEFSRISEEAFALLSPTSKEEEL